MKVEDIRNFVAVADAGSLVGAALKLGASEPTLSKSIARLERALRVNLVERHARGVRLTTVGASFLLHARTLDLDYRDSLAALRDLRQGRTGAVRIGVGTGIPQRLIATACKPVLEGREITLEIEGGMSDSLIEAVAGGKADFAITSAKPPRGATIKWTPLFPDPMVPLAPKGHRLALSRTVKWQDLSEEIWVVTNLGTDTRKWFDEQFTKRNLEPPSRIISLRGYPPALEIAEATNAISLLPVSTHQTPGVPAQYVELRKPPDWKSDRIVGLLERASGYISPASKALMSSIIAVSKTMFPGMSD